MRTNDFYGKSESKIIYGIAIIMMMYHHFFGFKWWLLPEIHWISAFNIFSIEIERYFASFGKLCIAIFAFGSGYAIWKFKSDYSSLKNTTRRLVKFLISYWIIMGLFLLYGAINKDDLPDVFTLLMNLIGLKTGIPNSYICVPFAWYVFFYTCLMFTAPLLIRIFNHKKIISDNSATKKEILTDLSIIFVLSMPTLLIPQSYQWMFLTPIAASLCGIFVSKYRLFDVLHEKASKWMNISYALITIFVIAVMRTGVIFYLGPNIGLLDGIFTFIWFIRHFA